jgi:hypothetical protein
MKIKNWSKFQHFKDRKPPWIKLYRDILDDMNWHQLDPLASKVLVMCWLIASEDDGQIPDAKTLAFRLRMSEKQISDCLIKLSHWLEQGDITPISERYQDDAPETETERETKTETKKKTAVADPPEGVSQSVWEDFVQLRKVKKAPITPSALSGIMREAAKSRWTLEQALTECCARGWVGFKAEWVQGAPSGLTVPSRPDRDPALVKLDEDRKKREQIPLEVRQQLQTILRRPA